MLLSAFNPLSFNKLSFDKSTAPLASPKKTLRFGEPLNILRFQDVFNRPELNKYGSGQNIKKRYQHLPQSSKPIVDQILKNKQMTPKEIARYYETGRLGLIEESADTLFEYYMYRTAMAGIINEDQIFSWVDNLNDLKAEGQSFIALQAFINEALTPQQYERFQELNGFSDAKISNALFAVSCLKPALFAMNGKPDPLIANTKHHFFGESEELIDELKHHPILQTLMRASFKMMIPLESIAGQGFSKILRKIISRELGLNTLIAQEDLARYILFKHTSRQDLDYSSSLKYDERKQVLKPFEVLVEAHLLKQLDLKQLDLKQLNEKTSFN